MMFFVLNDRMFPLSVWLALDWKRPCEQSARKRFSLNNSTPSQIQESVRNCWEMSGLDRSRIAGESAKRKEAGECGVRARVVIVYWLGCGTAGSKSIFTLIASVSGQACVNMNIADTLRSHRLVACHNYLSIMPPLQQLQPTIPTRYTVNARRMLQQGVYSIWLMFQWSMIQRI